MAVISTLVAALETVDAELAVAIDQEAARQAQLLLEACQAAGALEWVFALALFLDHGPALAGAAQYTRACGQRSQYSSHTCLCFWQATASSDELKMKVL